MFYFVKTPWLIKKIYPSCIWDIKTSEKIIYLTFDDGPHPEVTEFVLDVLNKYNAKATFFCIGKNVDQNKALYNKIIERGHKTGNHTNDHLNGWRTSDQQYLDNISDAGKLIDSNLFRPPYGRITRFQLQQLQKDRFKLKAIMWSVLSGDFDKDLPAEQCYINVTRYTRPGSIIVFHDSLKAYDKLKVVLPKMLDYFGEKGYSFQNIIL